MDMMMSNEGFVSVSVLVLEFVIFLCFMIFWKFPIYCERTELCVKADASKFTFTSTRIGNEIKLFREKMRKEREQYKEEMNREREAHNRQIREGHLMFQQNLDLQTDALETQMKAMAKNLET